MIDDIKSNLITAKKLGMGTILVSNKYDINKSTTIDYCFSNLETIFKKINNKDILNEKLRN